MKSLAFIDNPRSKPMVLLASSVEIFGHPQFGSIESMRTFFRAVGCSKEGVVAKALCEWLKTGRKFPAPTDIRELIASLEDIPTKKAAHG